MRPIGFSTGALAKGDFRRALMLLSGEARAVELSALREPELEPLLRSLSGSDRADSAGEPGLAAWDHVSLHAPSRMHPPREPDHAEAIARALPPRAIPCVVHPDALLTPQAWEPLGELLLIENMDRRKPAGRTAAELTEAFETFPDARLCFDVAHAWHVDPSLDEAKRILDTHGHRLAQIHLSGLTAHASHRPLDEEMLTVARTLAPRLPTEVPVILESTIEPDRERIRAEIAGARAALSRFTAGVNPQEAAGAESVERSEADE
jgi:hypothetical protein